MSELDHCVNSHGPTIKEISYRRRDQHDRSACQTAAERMPANAQDCTRLHSSLILKMIYQLLGQHR
jgi:hypothetical protein